MFFRLLLFLDDNLFGRRCAYTLAGEFLDGRDGAELLQFFLSGHPMRERTSILAEQGHLP